MTSEKVISVEPLARVEGHGGIEVWIKGGKIADVKINILEGPRLFETLLIGKTPQEDISLVPRICAICNLSHKYAAIRGLEKALDVRVPNETILYRDLMQFGEVLESHSLHLYFLALPDYFGYPSAIAMAEKYRNIVTGALELKQFSNRIMRILGGRMIHGENPVLGGFGKLPSDEILSTIKSQALDHMPFALETIDLLATLEIPDFMERNTQYLCLKPPTDSYGYYGDVLLTSDSKEHSLEDYKKVIEERVVSHSFAKRSSYRGSPFTTNALARIILLGDQLTGQAKDSLSRLFNQRWYQNPLYNNFAQAIEIVHCLENIVTYVDQLLGHERPEIAKPSRSTGIGTGGVEAPRGTLIHHYKVKDGRTVDADIITPTAMFLDDIEAFIRKGGENLTTSGKTEDLEPKFELIARSYDPCISCSAHLVTVKTKTGDQ